VRVESCEDLTTALDLYSGQARISCENVVKISAKFDVDHTTPAQSPGSMSSLSVPCVR